MTNQSPNSNFANNAPLAVKGLSKAFGDHKVLEGVDLTVSRGETVAVLGRSGTGKSVLLKLLIGLQRPDAGSIRINGQEVVDLAWIPLSEIRKRVGFLFQQAALYDSLTVEQNVAFPLERHTSWTPDQRRKQVRDLLSQVEMEHEGAKMPSEISGGMQKRVGIARALALNPEILMFDEPTSGLDPITADEIGKLISRLQKERNITSLVVTHDVRGASSFTDRFIVVHEGHILVEGTLQELKACKEEFVIQFLKGAV